MNRKHLGAIALAAVICIVYALTGSSSHHRATLSRDGSETAAMLTNEQQQLIYHKLCERLTSQIAEHKKLAADATGGKLCKELESGLQAARILEHQYKKSLGGNAPRFELEKIGLKYAAVMVQLAMTGEKLNAHFGPACRDIQETLVEADTFAVYQPSDRSIVATHAEYMRRWHQSFQAGRDAYARFHTATEFMKQVENAQGKLSHPATNEQIQHISGQAAQAVLAAKSLNKKE